MNTPNQVCGQRRLGLAGGLAVVRWSWQRKDGHVEPGGGAAGLPEDDGKTPV